MQALVTLFTLFLVSHAHGATVPQLERRITELNQQARPHHNRLRQLKSQDIHLQESSAMFLDRWHLINNLWIVAQNNQDSLESFTYLLPDFQTYMGQFLRHLPQVPSPEGNYSIQDRIHQLIHDYQSQLPQLYEDPSDEIIEQWVKDSMELYEEVTELIVQIQFNVSILMQNEGIPLERIQRQIEELNRRIAQIREDARVLRPEDTVYYWHSRGMQVP
jgi:phosphoribosyl-ATP pyrophosphohydrolase